MGLSVFTLAPRTRLWHKADHRTQHYDIVYSSRSEKEEKLDKISSPLKYMIQVDADKKKKKKKKRVVQNVDKKRKRKEMKKKRK